MVLQCAVGWVSESTTINENNVRSTCLLLESPTQGFAQHLSVFSISNREIASSFIMSLTDLMTKKTIGFGTLVHDVKSNCHVREMQRGSPRQMRQRAEGVDGLCRDSRWQGAHRLGCPQQLRRQCLIVQHVEISHMYQHQSRFGVFAHPEIDTKLVFDKNATLCHIFDQT